MRPTEKTVAMRQDAALTYSSDEADRKAKDLSVVTAATRMEAQPSASASAQKKTLASNLRPPLAPPPLAPRMRPEIAHSATTSAFAVAGSAGSLDSLSTPQANGPLAPPSNGRNIAATAAPSKAASPSAEQVEVTGSAVAMETEAAGSQEKQELPGKAKAPSGAAQYDSLVLAPSQDSGTQTVLANQAARKAEMKRAETLRPPVARWTISSDGQLQHSIDSGKTWQPVAVAENATFRALSANGPDLWVGGASGLLYHSTDAGAHWTQVKPATADATLTADIAAIEFIDVRQGKITASTGEVWITTDGGQSWRRQP